MAKTLEGYALSAFCEGVAMMLSAGIQTDEAILLFSESMEPGPFKTACDKVYRGLIDGRPLADAMADADAFPAYTLDMVRAGEDSGHLEEVMLNLARYYAEESRMFAKIRNAIVYPAALLGVMTVILLFTVLAILPVFVNVYTDIAGSLATSSFAYVNASLIIGWAAFIVMAVCTLCVIAALVMSRGPGRRTLLRLFQRLPMTRAAMYQLALSRFTSALAIFVSAGMDSDTAMAQTLPMIDHPELSKKARAAYDDMVDPGRALSLPQAVYGNGLFDPLRARMVVVGDRSGAIDAVLRQLSADFFEEAIAGIDGAVDSIEPALVAFLTISVGATLISVMLPLVGIMGSIG